MNPLAEKISDAEAEIMKVLWDAKEPITYKSIRTALIEKGEGWESPTINTLVNRLVKKGILQQEKKEVYYYNPVITEDEFMEAKTKTFLKKVYGGSAKDLLSALVTYDEVTLEDIDHLKEFLRTVGDDIE